MKKAPVERGTGQPAVLAEFRNFLNQYRIKNPHLDYRSAQQAASAAWHAERGTVKGGKKVTQAWNPLYDQTGGMDYTVNTPYALWVAAYKLHNNNTMPPPGAWSKLSKEEQQRWSLFFTARQRWQEPGTYISTENVGWPDPYSYLGNEEYR